MHPSRLHSAFNSFIMSGGMRIEVSTVVQGSKVGRSGPLWSFAFLSSVDLWAVWWLSHLCMMCMRIGCRLGADVQVVCFVTFEDWNTIGE